MSVRPMDRQTDMGVCTPVRTHARMHMYQHTNIEVRSKKLKVRSKKLEVRSKKLEIRKFTDCHIYMHVHTHTYTHTQTRILPNLFHCSLTISGHSQTSRITVPIELNSVFNSCDTLQANASVCDTFWRLADFQDLGANRVKPCFYLL